ncbi:serine hydrolase [Caulobacter zeae]|uniref:Serine hydrolase n=1 Tax=Caulobacter zeae TaxID=2055137 RepID=A0A2N5DGQ2_9CAUL|nr:serine hydrolase [Caulobacter zeae]PLR25238.1 serine hydrolase [Caulobacter zeae]
MRKVAVAALSVGLFRRLAIAAAALLVALLVAMPAAAQTASPSAAAETRLSDAAIRQVLVQRVDVDKQAAGIVVGVIDAKGRRVIARGVFDAADPRPVDGQTLFEIGSVTKAFTGLLLADMVRRGEVTLDEPLVKLLPAGSVAPERNGKAITLIDLATHTSGLPRLPDNMPMTDPLNPYADYGPDLLDAFLRRYSLTRDVGAAYEYSNLGAGLLGRALAQRAGGDYETVLRKRVLAPLGMSSTAIALSPALEARFSPGHTADLATTPHWDLPTLAGAGGLRSSADDLLKLLAAELGYVDTPLRAAMVGQLDPRRPVGGDVQVALGWHVAATPKGEIVSHGGGTMGFQTFVGFDQTSGVGVVVLSNASGAMGVEDLGLHLLTGAPLKTAPKVKVREAKTLPPIVLDGLTGRYALGPGAVMAITREGQRMFGQLTGQPRIEIFAEGPTAFFTRVVDAQLTFTVGADGRASSVTLHQNGQNTPAPRLAEGAEPPAAPTPKVVALSPQALDALVGRYALAPAMILEVTRREGRLFAQLTGQPVFEVFPQSPTEVVWAVVPARAQFVLGADGKAISLVLHQNGRALPAPRVP